MTHDADRFSILLWAYPRDYRDRRGEEILGTLLDGAPTCNGWETLRVGWDVVAHGLRLRFGIASDQSGGKVLAAAALPGLMMAGATAIVMPLFAQFLLGLVYHSSVAFGLDTAIWPALFSMWFLSALAAFAFPRRTRAFAALCVIATVVTAFVLPSHDGYLPSACSLLIALAVPALLAPRTSLRRWHRGFALLVAVVVLCVLVPIFATSPGAPVGFLAYMLLGSPNTLYVAGAVVFCAAAFLVARRLVRATALLLLAVPWFLFPSGELQFGASSTIRLVMIELACAVGIGLLGRAIAHEWKAPEAVH